MGSPQRQPSYPPDQPERASRQGPQLENLRQVDKLDKDVSSGWRFGFWWIWALVIVGIWWVGYGWGGSGGWLRPHHNAVQNDAAISGPGIDMLNAENKGQFVNRLSSFATCRWREEPAIAQSGSGRSSIPCRRC